MRAVIVTDPGGPAALSVQEVPDPVPAEDELLVEVGGAGVNRADLLQRQGLYPPPPGASDVLGLEVAGVVARTAAGFHEGERVMSLLEGGGYAELAVARPTQTARIPRSLDLVEAGGVPEAFITAHDNLFTRAGLQAGETLLVHGGAGGVGTAAIQLARAVGCRVIATAGAEIKLERCRALGAEAVSYRDEDFVARTLELTEGHGADVVLDIMGAAYLERNLAALATDGRLVIIGLQGGTRAELDLGLMSRRRLLLAATQLRARPASQKATIVEAFAQAVLPGLADGTLRPVIDRVLPLAEAAAAHQALEDGEVVGKVVLRMG